MPQPDLILVDGSSYLYRAFHALPPLTNTRGEPTGAVYGVINMLRRLLKDYESEHVAIIFDAKGKTFRDDLYADYKANRPPMPDDLACQIEPLHTIIRAMGLPILVIDGVEADDVIATLARAAEKIGWQVLISTGDKDLTQLVDDAISLIDTMTNTHLDAGAVKQKFGVSPNRIPDYLSLVGDTVDNVPGVPKCGPKTATKWLQQYESLDGVITHAGDIKGKIGENLRATLSWLPRAKELVTVRANLALPVQPENLKPSPPDHEALCEWFQRLEFKSWLHELVSSSHAEPAALSRAKAGAYTCILDEPTFNVWLARLQTAEIFAFDTETTGLNYMQAEIVGMSFAIKPGEAAYLPLAHDYQGAPEQLNREQVLARLKTLLQDASHPKLGHNLKYDRNVLANHGITLEGIQHDTMLESYILNATANRHDLDTLAATYLAHQTLHFEDVAGKGAKQVSFNQVSLEQAAPYAAEDADISLRLHRLFWPRLQAEPGLRRVYEEIEIPLIRVLSHMERTGVCVDADRLRQQSRELSEHLVKIEQQARDLAGSNFNLGSPKQIQEILFKQLHLPILRKTPKGQPSTAEDVLEELAAQHEFPRLILNYRAMAKLKSTYTDQLPKCIDSRTGRVHTSYQQAVTSTGRLASSNPNLQNIPVRTPEGRRIRQAFIAPPGHSLIAADYSQIELRIMAHLSSDPGLLDAFAAGKDIHKATAAEIFNVPPDDVNPAQRRAAKAINFGLIYGMSAFGLARQISIGRVEAQDYIDRYFARYPEVRHFMDTTRAQAHKQGFVETLFGRRLYVPNIRSRNPQQRAQAERMAINAPLQGTAADIIKRAMIRVDRWLENEGLPLCMILQVHDELVLEAPDNLLGSASCCLREYMENAAQLQVPLRVEIGIGKDWDAAH